MVYEIVAKSRKEKNKSNITLTDHTSELLNQIESLKTHLQRLSVYCEEKNKKNETNHNVPWQILEYAAALHDLGKVSPAFQVNSLENWNYSPKALFPSVPHSILSIFLSPLMHCHRYPQMKNVYCFQQLRFTTGEIILVISFPETVKNFGWRLGK